MCKSSMLLCTAVAAHLFTLPALAADGIHPAGRNNLAVAAANAAESAPRWYAQGAQSARQGAALKPIPNKARNVILFVGDGMSLSTVTAARILEGQLKGRTGEENALSFETLPYVSLSKTYSVDGQAPDSAPTMTAMVTGIKTREGVLSVTQNVRYNDCASARGQNVATILEISEALGLATGLVSTARITHATPAATYAHTPDRDWESDDQLSDEAKANGCKDIARQLLEFPHGNGPEVVLGGGRRHFLPDTMADPEDPGKTGDRKDGRNLTREWTDTPNARYVWNKAQFDAINPRSTSRLLGLFERSHMEYEADRSQDAGTEPSLADMTAKAIDMLDRRSDKGYFLMVESGRIDHAHHAGNAARALHDTIALSDAVRVALRKTSDKDTLIIVTADHSHTMTIGGYPDRGNDILGKVVVDGVLSLAGDGKPYTTLSYANGPGWRGVGARPDLSMTPTHGIDYLQEATVPRASETHAAEDVGIYARGPGANALLGVVEQHVIFHVMAQAQGNINQFLCSVFSTCANLRHGKPAMDTGEFGPLLESDLRNTVTLDNASPRR